MSLTMLESLLLAALVSAIVGVVVKTRCVTPSACHQVQGQMLEAIKSLKKNNDIQFRMLRALVAHSTLSEKVRAEILNMGPTDS